MRSSFLVGVYYYNRYDSLSTSAARLSHSLQALSRCHTVLSHWFLKANDLERALATEIETSELSLAECLRDSDQKSREGNLEIYHFAIWNGEVESPISCSMTTGEPTDKFPHCCIVTGKLPSLDMAESKAVLSCAFNALIDSWQPQYGIVTQQKLLQPSVVPWMAPGWLRFNSEADQKIQIDDSFWQN